MAFLADMVDHVNQVLNDSHASIGPSHFLVKDLGNLTEERAEVIWNHSILPALADRFFDTPDELKRFEYREVRNRTTPDDTVGVPVPTSGDAEDDDDTPTNAN